MHAACAKRHPSAVSPRDTSRALAVLSLSALGVGLALAPGAVSAQPAAIHATSDALYIGARAEPGGAWLFAYDLDLTVPFLGQAATLGPSVSISFGGSGSTDLGRRQEYLFTADLLRARITLGQTYGFRGMALVGAGFYVVSLYDQRTELRAAVEPGGAIVQVQDHYPSALLPGAMLTVGAGADWYWDGQWGLCIFLVGHVRLDDQNRMPALWVEAGIGVRLGE